MATTAYGNVLHMRGANYAAGEGGYCLSGGVVQAVHMLRHLFVRDGIRQTPTGRRGRNFTLRILRQVYPDCACPWPSDTVPSGYA